MATDTVTDPVTTAPSRVLVVDDERSMRELLSIVLKRDGYEVMVADDGVRAIELLKKQRVDILITDIRMPQMSGVDVLREAKNIDPEIISIVMTAFASTDTAVEALRLGAADYVHKSPSAANELRLRVRKELERKHLQRENVLLKRALQSAHKFSNIIGRSDPMLAVFQLIETIAPDQQHRHDHGRVGHRQGARGTGDSLQLAQERSPVCRPQLRGALRDAPRLGALRPHEGSFTGADTNKKGLIEVAERGSIFLDEIGEMSQLVQVKLLRVLQERKYRRLGGTEEVEADIRVIAATNRDLGEDGRGRARSGKTCSTASTSSPSGCPRSASASRISRSSPSTSSVRFATEMGKTISGVSGAAMACLQAYAWPGNIRELENAIERAVALERTPSILGREPARRRCAAQPPPRPVQPSRPRASPTTASTSSSTSNISSASTSPRRSDAPAG